MFAICMVFFRFNCCCHCLPFIKLLVYHNSSLNNKKKPLFKNVSLEFLFSFLRNTNFLFAQMDVPPLSPYPFVRTGSPRRIQLSQNHSVYISPHKNETMPSPREKISYYFSKSPSKVSLTYLGLHSQMLRMLEEVNEKTRALTQMLGPAREKWPVSPNAAEPRKRVGGRTFGLEIE